MTPELSRQLAHIKNGYDRRSDCDFKHSRDFLNYVKSHEEDINSLKDVPAMFSDIIG